MIDYIKQATRTESLAHFRVDNPRLLHAAIGFNTEVAELILADEDDIINVKEELGDICWYIAIACDELNVSFEDLLTLANRQVGEDDPFKAMVGSASEALDIMKRALFYGVEVDEAGFAIRMATLLYVIQILAEDEGWTIADLQEANIAKLTRRFPDKFTTEAAVNRDLEAEREEVGT